MATFTKERMLNYAARDIFALVMNIESYPQFLPWCRGAKIVEKIGEDCLYADLLINFKGFSEKYRSEVKFYQDGDDFVIESRAISGPFKYLDSKWLIRDVEKGSCFVVFEVDFAFNSMILNKMIGVVFEKASLKMMDAFEGRARAVL